jgi:hypothetical protein
MHELLGLQVSVYRTPRNDEWPPYEWRSPEDIEEKVAGLEILVRRLYEKFSKIADQSE